MLRFGQKQEMAVVKKVEFGVYLSPIQTDDDLAEDEQWYVSGCDSRDVMRLAKKKASQSITDENQETAQEEEMEAEKPQEEEKKPEPRKETVLLPRNQVPEGTEIGDRLTVFLYKDSRDRPIATMKNPKITLHGLALLEVVQLTPIGAFLDWGLDKDLLLPFREQTAPVKEGDKCLVTMYVDKSERMCASMKVYHFLSTDSPYSVGDMATGIVYEISEKFGVFVAVDYLYSALIPKREAQAGYEVGQVMDVRITEVKPDGKLCVSTRKQAYLQVEDDAKHILEIMDAGDGTIPFDDKAAPEKIKDYCGMSKNAFKRAVGHLLRGNLILINSGTLVRKE